MSVIVKMIKQKNDELDRDLEGKEEWIFLLTKGSDDIVIENLSKEKSPDLQLVKK